MIEEVKSAVSAQNAAEEEKKESEQQLIAQFQANLELPSYPQEGRPSAGKAHRSGNSPRSSKKKKSSKAQRESSPKGSGAQGASSAARTHKNKKTTK